MIKEKKDRIISFQRSIAFRSIFSVVVLLVLLSVFVSLIGHKSLTDALLNLYSKDAFLTADTAALLVDADRIQAYRDSNGTTEEYQTVYSDLDELCNSTDSTFIYVIIPDLTDFEHITFLFSTINHKSSYTMYDFLYYRPTTNDDYKEKYRALYDGTMDRALVIRDKGYIETDAHITAMVPIRGDDRQTKAILCVQRQMDVLARTRSRYLLNILFLLFLLAVIVIVSLSIYLYRVFLRPVQRITAETSRFARENSLPDKKLKETVYNRDEIGLLAESVDQMEEKINHYIDHMTQVAAERERMSAELSLAARIQADMLPNHFPAFPQRSEFDIYAVMDPARNVGGDFYDFFLIDDDHLYLSIADVSGKGIPAALFMMASKIILGNNAMALRSPAKILSATNMMIAKDNKEEMFVTVWLGILEISTGILTAASAGHEYPMLKKADGNFELFKDRHGLPVGAMAGVPYKDYELHLTPGSRLFVYTDGVPEAINTREEMFGTERTLRALNGNVDAEPSELLRNVSNAMKVFTEDTEQFDDTTMLVLDYKGTENSNSKQ